MLYLWAQTMTGLTAVVRRNWVRVVWNFLLFHVHRQDNSAFRV